MHFQVGVDEGAFGDAIRAYHRLIDLREKHVDPQALGLIAKAVVENVPDIDGRGANRHSKDLLALFGRATATVSWLFRSLHPRPSHFV